MIKEQIIRHIKYHYAIFAGKIELLKPRYCEIRP